MSIPIRMWIDLIPLMAEGHDPALSGHAPAAREPARCSRPCAGRRRRSGCWNAWRAGATICPELVLRSTFIVGFPGETEADFETLLDFLRAARLDRVGCFAYSPVAGAAANALPDPVPEAVKQERLARFMAVQAEISREKLAQRVGQRLIVLVDEVEEGRVIARSRRRCAGDRRRGHHPRRVGTGPR